MTTSCLQCMSVTVRSAAMRFFWFGRLHVSVFSEIRRAMSRFFWRRRDKHLAAVADSFIRPVGQTLRHALHHLRDDVGEVLFDAWFIGQQRIDKPLVVID